MRTAHRDKFQYRAGLYGSGGSVLEQTDLGGELPDDYVFLDGARVAAVDAGGNSRQLGSATSRAGARCRRSKPRRQATNGSRCSKRRLCRLYASFGDALGSTRVEEEIASGASSPTLVFDADYHPFGSERDFTSTIDPNFKFTGKQRDPETGLDDFGARFYSPVMGRFLTPDWSAAPEAVPYANLNNPQSLNLYGYVGDNPLTFTDADGHCWWFFCAIKDGIVHLGEDLIANFPSQAPDLTPDVATSVTYLYLPSAAEAKSAVKDSGGGSHGEWIYDQKTGLLSHVSPDGNVDLVGVGYSGFGKWHNDPTMQGVKNEGPIPQGGWHIGPQELVVTSANHALRGALPLSPLPGTNTFGRTGFLIHGDNQYQNLTASQGCVIMGSGMRDEVGQSPDRTLMVVP